MSNLGTEAGVGPTELSWAFGVDKSAVTDARPSGVLHRHPCCHMVATGVWTRLRLARNLELVDKVDAKMESTDAVVCRDIVGLGQMLFLLLFAGAQAPPFDCLGPWQSTSHSPPTSGFLYAAKYPKSAISGRKSVCMTDIVLSIHHSLLSQILAHAD
eukprot:2354642-Amphidinium_carterae.1